MRTIARMSTTLQRLESDDKRHGGVVLTFPSGAAKSVTWSTGEPIHPPLDAAKGYAAQVLDALMREGRIDDADRTNWASVVAAMVRLIEDFNLRLEGAGIGGGPLSARGCTPS